MSAIAKQILARIDAAIAEKALGTGTAGAHWSVASGSVLRVRDIEKAAKKLAALPKPAVGIVCRPEAVTALRRIAEENAHPQFGALPVYGKPDQKELCRAFYDYDEMVRYLTPNTEGSRGRAKP